MSFKTKEEHAAYMREWYRKKKEADPEAYREMVRKRDEKAKKSGKAQERQRRANQIRQRVLDKIKCRIGCTDCKDMSLPPECLEFDHLPGCVKEFQIGAARRLGWDRVLDEIEKCEVVCANCHRIRTVSRKREKGLLPIPEARPTEDHMGRGIDLEGEAKKRGLL